MCCVTGVNQVVFRHPLRESIFRYAPVVGFVRAVFPGGATTPGRPVPVPYTRHAPVAVANVAPRAQFVRLDEGLSGVNGINGVNGVNVSGVSGVSSNAGAATGDVQKVREELEAQKLLGWLGHCKLITGIYMLMG